MFSLTETPDDAMAMPTPIDPAPDLQALGAWLLDRHYSAHAMGVILGHAGRVGSLEGLEEMGYLDPADRAGADELLEAAWPPVGPTSHAWDEDRWDCRPSRWTIAGGVLLPPELGPDFIPSEEDEAFVAAWSAAREAEIEAAAVLVPDPEIFPIHF